MRRKFITNLAFILAVNLLVKPFWILGVDRSVQNMLGAESYGLYFSLFNFTILFNIVLDIGITNFNNKELAQENRLLSRHINALVPLKLVLGLAYGLLLGAIAIAIGYGKQQFTLISSLAVNQFLLSFLLYFRSNFSALHQFRTDSLFSVLDRILVILFCCIMFYVPALHETFNIRWFVGLQTLAYIISVCSAIIITYRHTRSLHPRWDLSFSVSALKQSLPYAVLALLMSFYTRIDSVMIERLCTDGAFQSGIYAQAFRIFDIGNNIAFLFGGLLLPLFARMIKQSQPVHRLVSLSSLSLLYPALLIAAAACIFGQPIMSLLYHCHIEPSALMLRFLMFSFIGICFSYIFGALLTANGNLQILNKIAACSLATNLVLNSILIPHYGALGAAVTSLATQSVSALLQFMYCRKYFNITIAKRNLSLILASISSISMLCFYLQLKGLMFAYNLFIFFTLNLSSIFIFKIIDIKELKKNIKMKNV